MSTRAAARALAELEQRERRGKFTAEAQCRESAPQLKCVQSRRVAKRRVIVAGRRAGKTRGVHAGELLEDALLPPFAPQLFMAPTRRWAKEIIWDDLLELNDTYSLGGVANIADLTLTFPKCRGSKIMLAGANNERETAKVRGKKFKTVKVDEFQGIPEHVAKPLLLDIIGPTLVDYSGRLDVSGTPTPVDAGFFYDIAQGKLAHLWEQFRWDLLSNPYLHRMAGKTGEQILADVMKEHGWDENHPSFLREYRGLWVLDLDALLFEYLADRNNFTERPAGTWTYVFGVDQGSDDSDAIAVLGWSDRDPRVFLVEEHVQDKQDVTDLAEKTKELIAKYHPIHICIDQGGGGKKTAEEIRRRHHIPLQPAEKSEKPGFTRLFNADLRKGSFMASQFSRFALDCKLVQKDPKALLNNILQAKPRAQGGFHSDICDAVLYGWRACRHYLFKPAPPPQTEKDRMDEHHRKLAEMYDPNRKPMPWMKRDARRLGR